MWEIDNRLIVWLNKNHETLENIWYFKTRINNVSTNTPQTSPTKCKFYEYDIVAQVYDVSCPRIAFFHNFWLKCHEKLKRYDRETPVLGLFFDKVTGWSAANIVKWDSGTGA